MDAFGLLLGLVYLALIAAIGIGVLCLLAALLLPPLCRVIGRPADGLGDRLAAAGLPLALLGVPGGLVFGLLIVATAGI